MLLVLVCSTAMAAAANITDCYISLPPDWKKHEKSSVAYANITNPTFTHCLNVTVNNTAGDSFTFYSPTTVGNLLCTDDKALGRFLHDKNLNKTGSKKCCDTNLCNSAATTAASTLGLALMLLATNWM